MARIAVEIEGDNPPDPESLPNPPRFNVELPHTSCFTEDQNGGLTRKFFTTPDELSNHLERAIPRQKERRLYVLEGLPIEYVQVLGLHFNTDVDIFDSHAMRRSGQLNKLKFSTRPANEKKVRIFALDHPEIAANITPLPEANEEVVGDFMLPRQTIGISNEGRNGISVKLCHVTLVCFPEEDGSETLLLLLENQSWARRGAQFQTASYHSILANALKSLPEGKQKWKPSQKHDPALTLADEIFNSIESPGGNLVWDDLTEILADIVLRQWKLTLGEVMKRACASRLIPYHEIHRVCDLIESNIWTLDRTEAFWSPRYDVRMQGFKRLLEQAKRYAELFVWGQIVEEGLETKAKIESGSENEDDDDTTSTTSSKSGVHIRGGEALDLETRQSINRVTYLGGVLLPFSIVAAIFSMGGNFQPGGDQFFIFWVIAIPVCMLTTVLIYADSIRRMTLEQFAQQYGSTAVTAEAADMVASSISGSEISYKAGIKERLTSRIPGIWNPRRAGSSSSVGYTDSDSSSNNGSSSTGSTRLPPGLSIDGDLLVRRKKKKVPRVWSWRFWRRKPLDRKSDPENVLSSPTHSDHNVSSPSAPHPPHPPSPPSRFHPIPTSPKITPVKPMPVGNNPPESLASDHSPIAGPAPPKTPPTSPPSPNSDLIVPDQTISEPIVSEPSWGSWGTPSKKPKKGKKSKKSKYKKVDLNDDFDSPDHSHIAHSPAHRSTPDPAEIPLPPSDSDSDDWRERDSSEGIFPERSPSPGHADSDYATDRERRSLDRRMRENDDWELTRRRSREHPSSGDGYERVVEREIILHRRRRSEHSVTSERKHSVERSTEKLVEEQERKHAADVIVEDDDDVPEDRGRQRRRSTTRRVHHGTYYDYPRRPTPNIDPTEIPLPPSPEELREDERIRTQLDREKLEYLEKLKQKERHKRMAEMEEEHAKKRAEEEHAKRRAEEEYARKIAEEEYKEKAAASKAAKGKHRAYSPVMSDDKGAKPAIKFKDAVGRKFMFPFHLVSTWAGMENLVKQAFLHVDVIGPHVNDGHYDLLGPTGEIILPQVWESVIEPGWLITMHMWPMPEPRRQAPAPVPPRPRHPGNFPPPPPPPPGFTATQPGGPMSGPTPRMKKSTQTETLAWMTGARHSKSRKKQKSVPIRLGPPPPPSFPGHHPPPQASGRRGSDTVVIIEELPPKVHRRQTGMSDRQRHGTSGGGMIGGVAKPNEELGWVRALGTIVGVKPGIQVKKRSGGSNSSSSV